MSMLTGLMIAVQIVSYRSIFCAYTSLCSRCEIQYIRYILLLQKNKYNIRYKLFLKGARVHAPWGWCVRAGKEASARRDRDVACGGACRWLPSGFAAVRRYVHQPATRNLRPLRSSQGRRRSFHLPTRRGPHSLLWPH